LRQTSDVDRVETVHVLLEVDGGEYFFFIEVAGQRQLHEDAVDRGVRVELANQGFDFLLGGIFR